MLFKKRSWVLCGNKKFSLTPNACSYERAHIVHSISNVGTAVSYGKVLLTPGTRELQTAMHSNHASLPRKSVSYKGPCVTKSTEVFP